MQAKPFLLFLFSFDFNSLTFEPAREIESNHPMYSDSNWGLKRLTRLMISLLFQIWWYVYDRCILSLLHYHSYHSVLIKRTQRSILLSNWYTNTGIWELQPQQQWLSPFSLALTNKVLGGSRLCKNIISLYDIFLCSIDHRRMTELERKLHTP